MLRTLQGASSQLTAEALQQAAGVAAVLLIFAVFLAWAAARGSRKLLKQRYSPSVLKATLGLVKAGHAPVVAISLADGSTVDGVLHAYSLGGDESSPTIALKAPIRRLNKGDKGPVVVQIGYFIAFGSDIKHVTMTQVLDRGATHSKA